MWIESVVFYKLFWGWYFVDIFCKTLNECFWWQIYGELHGSISSPDLGIAIDFDNYKSIFNKSIDTEVTNVLINTLNSEWNGRYFTHDIFNHIFVNRNDWIWIKFHDSLFPGVQLTICQYWLNWWLSVKQATSHHLNQCWPNSSTPYIITIWHD